MVTGWLVVRSDDVARIGRNEWHPSQDLVMEFWPEPDGPEDAPYSNDEGVVQWHVAIDRAALAPNGDPYPTLRVIE